MWKRVNSTSWSTFMVVGEMQKFNSRKSSKRLFSILCRSFSEKRLHLQFIMVVVEIATTDCVLLFNVRVEHLSLLLLISQHTEYTVLYVYCNKMLLSILLGYGWETKEISFRWEEICFMMDALRNTHLVMHEVIVSSHVSLLHHAWINMDIIHLFSSIKTEG